MSFKDHGWEARYEKMGDQAEAVFEDVADRVLKLGIARCGLDRPPLQMHALPARIRYWPDYLMSKKFIEVQGFGRDQKVKLKLSKWGCLRWWNDVHPVEMFLYDSHNSRWCFVTLDQLEALLATEHAGIDAFHEGHVYFWFKGDAVFELSDLVGEAA